MGQFEISDSGSATNRGTMSSWVDDPQRRRGGQKRKHNPLGRISPSSPDESWSVQSENPSVGIRLQRSRVVKKP